MLIWWWDNLASSKVWPFLSKRLYFYLTGNSSLFLTWWWYFSQFFPQMTANRVDFPGLCFLLKMCSSRTFVLLCNLFILVLQQLWSRTMLFVNCIIKSTCCIPFWEVTWIRRASYFLQAVKRYVCVLIAIYLYHILPLKKEFKQVINAWTST